MALEDNQQSQLDSSSVNCECTEIFQLGRKRQTIVAIPIASIKSYKAFCGHWRQQYATKLCNKLSPINQRVDWWAKAGPGCPSIDVWAMAPDELAAPCNGVPCEYVCEWVNADLWDWKKRRMNTAHLPFSCVPSFCLLSAVRLGVALLQQDQARQLTPPLVKPQHITHANSFTAEDTSSKG